MARKLTNRSSVSRGTMPVARPNGWGAVKYGFQPTNRPTKKASSSASIAPAKKSASKKVNKK